jgi:hypothetical protein
MTYIRDHATDGCTVEDVLHHAPMGRSCLERRFRKFLGRSPQAEINRVRMRDLMPRVAEWKRSIAPIFRGSFIGFFIGLLPGPSPVISTFVSYLAEKKASKHPSSRSHIAIEDARGPFHLGCASEPILPTASRVASGEKAEVDVNEKHGTTPTRR